MKPPSRARAPTTRNPAPLRRALLRWYDAHRRRLPWREHPTPYRTWISEIMLQQTQVTAVLPFYARFLKRFPDAASLARARESEVLRLWAGLGYYSRARNLRRAAVEVMARHGGRFPETFDEVLALPGIGRYTAGAILSIAFGKPYPVVDGNVMRVFARVFAIRDGLKEAGTRKRMWSIAEELLDRARPGDWNQALMELGAAVCLPESPRCGDCPAAGRCAARRLGLQDELPRAPAPRAPVALHWTSLWIERGPRVLLWKRSKAERFLPEHWSLPEARHLGISADDRGRVAVVRHTITHHRITLEIRRASPPRTIPRAARWVGRSDLRRHLVSSLWLKALASVG